MLQYLHMQVQMRCVGPKGPPHRYLNFSSQAVAWYEVAR